MSSLPQKPPAGQKQIRGLLEKHSPRETFDILATRIALANERVRDPLRSSRLQTRPQRTSLTAQDLEDIRTGRYGRIQLPTQEEARYWLQQWREGARSKEDTPTPKILIRRNRTEVRE
jgi:hypothetical protein